ncbi:MAG: peptide chain release factor N(5)-glutamine methyltransferase [Candidatus Omnitrophota bacterium]
MNETELLFSTVLGCDRASLYLNRDRYLDRRELDFIASALKRRIRREPIQYILGKTEFMGLEFEVNQDVLIPRPETEILVETAIKYVQGRRVQGKRILDLGTGSGCIAISLAKYLSGIKIDASDISDRALATARRNAKLHGVSINFRQSDLFTPGSGRYDLIVSNPPYIAQGRLTGLQAELRFEPEAALNAGPDGLDFYRRIVSGSPSRLKENGLLIMEIGFGQAGAVGKIFSRSGKFRVTEIIKDYNQIERVIVAGKAEANG